MFFTNVNNFFLYIISYNISYIFNKLKDYLKNIFIFIFVRVLCILFIIFLYSLLFYYSYESNQRYGSIKKN